MSLGPAFSSDRQAFGLPSITSEQDARWSEWRTRYREIGPEDLRAAGAGARAASTFSVPLNYAMKKFDISNSARQAAFLANVALETSDEHLNMLSSLEEDATLYTVNRIRKAFAPTEKHPGRFPDDAAIKAVLHNPADIAHPDKKGVVDPKKFFNRLYGHRTDLGNRPHTDDGYTYRGRGVLGLTGRGRYLACGIVLGADLISHPELVRELFYGCLAGAWAWCEVAYRVAGKEHLPRNLNLIADVDTAEAFDKTCGGVNHGDVDALRHNIKIHGIDQRRQFWPKFKHALHQRDLRLFHVRMAGVPARVNLFDDFKRPTVNDDGVRTRFLRDSTRARAMPR